MTTALRGILLSVLLSASALVLAADKSADSYSLDFDVYLDNAPIGFHRFSIENGEDGRLTVSSEAKFDVKFLFITAFRYHHENAERWSNGCLVQIDAETDSNGKETVVSGERTESGFAVKTGESVRQLPGCVMTFAYWNPDFLREDRLLNPQTGEYLDVEVEKRAEQTVKIGGRDVLAVPYDIRARGMELTVWYSPDKQWLALESLAKGGRTIRYELS